ncbi:MAG: 3'-5' exonuclease [Spirochaetota bacterium]
MRSSSNQIRLERMLRLFGVPYVSQAARSLFLEAPVNDLYQALQLVLYPADRVAHAGFLRSPLVGLSDEGIVRLLLTEGAFLDPVPGLSEDDLRRLELARARYDELCELADTRPITGLLHHIWYHWGYRYHLLRRSEYIPYLEYYDHFWELAHTFEERGLAAFLDEVRGHIGQNEKLDELETLRGDEAGVQIMTIHKSKGLEFPVVIVANAGNRGRADSVSSSPWYWSSERGLAFNAGTLPPGAVREKAANYLYTYELDEAKAQDLAEMKRLLYVAATRAEGHLVFSGVAREDERSLMGILAPAFEGAREELAAHEAPVALDVVALGTVSPEEEHQAHRAGGRRTIAELAARYAELEVIDRAYAPVELTATALNQRLLEAATAAHAAAAHGAAEPAAAAESSPAPAPAVFSPAPGAIVSPEHPVDATLREY